MTTVSPQERRLYDGLATIENITNNYNLVKIGSGIQLKITKLETEGYILNPMSLTHNILKDNQNDVAEWSDIYEVFGQVNSVQKQVPTFDFPEQKLTKAFGKPGRHQSWKMVSMLTEEKMEQLYLDKKDTWMNLNLWANRIGTQQGWTKVNEDLFKIKNRKNKVDMSTCRIPKIRSHNESLPFYNADKANVTNGRFIFPFNKVVDE